MSGGAVGLNVFSAYKRFRCWRAFMLAFSVCLRPSEEARRCQPFLLALGDEVIRLKWHHWFK